MLYTVDILYVAARLNNLRSFAFLKLAANFQFITTYFRFNRTQSQYRLKPSLFTWLYLFIWAVQHPSNINEADILSISTESQYQVIKYKKFWSSAWNMVFCKGKRN